MTRTVEGTVLLNLAEERIRALWRYRSWYRTHRWAEWPLRRHETDAELRALVRLLRKARRLAAKAPDPVTTAKAEADRHADCECHYINRQGDREYPSDYFDGDHYVYERAAS